MPTVTSIEADGQQPGVSRLICVLGMHRSGTSAITQLLHRFGAKVGAQLLDAMAGVNDEGFWEDSRVVDLNERLLAACASRWQDHTALDSAHPETLSALRREACAYCAEHYASADISVIKDPRLCRLLPFWLEVWREVGFEVCFVNVLRHPYAVAKSLHQRDRIPGEYGVLLWLVYTLEAMSHSAGQPGIVVAFDAFSQSPLDLPRLLESRCGIRWPLAPALWEETAAATIKPGLRHQDDELPGGAALPDLMAFAATVYDALRAPAGADLAMLNAGLQALLDRRGNELALLKRLTDEVMALSSEAVRIGELHSRALSVIADKDAGLKESAELYAAAVRVVQERDRTLEERDRTLEERDRTLEERDRTLEERDRVLEERNRILEERNRALEDRNQLIRDIKYLRFWRILPRIIRRIGSR